MTNSIKWWASRHANKWWTVLYNMDYYDHAYIHSYVVIMHNTTKLVLCIICMICIVCSCKDVIHMHIMKMSIMITYIMVNVSVSIEHRAACRSGAYPASIIKYRRRRRRRRKGISQTVKCDYMFISICSSIASILETFVIWYIINNDSMICALACWIDKWMNICTMYSINHSCKMYLTMWHDPSNESPLVAWSLGIEHGRWYGTHMRACVCACVQHNTDRTPFTCCIACIRT